MPEPSTAEHAAVQEISPIVGLFAGVAAFCSGAALAGSTHFVGTAKKLEEEGINKQARLNAVPTAAKALAVSTAACCVVGAIGFFAFQALGVQAKDSTQVSSLHGAIELAEYQRAFVRDQFRKRLLSWQDEGQEENSN